MTLIQAEVEAKLASIIGNGDFKCYRCGKPLGGSAITGLQLEAADGKPKVVYRCDNPICPNKDKDGYRSLLALGIADNLLKVGEGSALLGARPPENLTYTPPAMVLGPNGPVPISPVSPPADEPSDDEDAGEDADGDGPTSNEDRAL